MRAEWTTAEYAAPQLLEHGHKLDGEVHCIGDTEPFVTNDMAVTLSSDGSALVIEGTAEELVGLFLRCAKLALEAM